MQLFNKLQDQYDQLWKYIIRPNRTTYPDSALGPDTFYLENIKVKRNSFQLINDRGLVFYGSHFVPLEAESYPCVIYLHGNSSNQTQGVQYLAEMIRNNISLCTFDFTGCGNSEGEYVTLGYNQWKDVEEVYNYVRGKKKVTQIGLWGRSMGAVTALKYAHKNPEIKVVVFDSPFKNLKSLISDICKKNSKIPSIILNGALKIISKTIKDKANFDIYDLDPIKDDAPHIQAPGFFIVGEEDELIPPTHTEMLFQAYSSKKKKLRKVKGEHNSNRPQSCVKEAIKFLNKYLNKNERKMEEEEKNAEAIVEEVDFFEGSQNEEPPPREDLEDIDFFAEEAQEKLQSLNFDDFDENTFETAKTATNSPNTGGLFGLNEIFAGVFSQKSGKGKRQKVDDGYEETRKRIESLLGSEKYKQNNLKAETTFQKLMENHGEEYIWS